MSLFQNSNANTWRGQQDRQSDSYQNPEPENSPHTNNAKSQDTQSFSSGQDWMKNPSLSGIDPARLQMLSSLAAQAQSKNQNELLPFLMAAASQQNTGMSFRPDEINTIINVMKIGKSPQEIQQIDRICTLMRQFGSLRGLNQSR